MGFRNAPVTRKLRTAPSGPRVEISSEHAETIELFTGDPSEQLPAQAYVAVDGTRHTGLLFLRPPSLRPNELAATYLLLEGTSSDGSPSPTVAGGWTLAGPGTVSSPIAGPDADWSPLTLAGPTWVPYDTGGNLPSIRKGAGGNVQIEGIVALSAGTFASGFSSTIGSLSAPYIPTRNSHRSCPIFNASGAWIGTGLLSINTAGSMSVLNGSGTTLTAGSGFGIGTTIYRAR
jgi:hypothetical protein